MLRLRIRAPKEVIWRSPDYIEATVLKEAIPVADKLARACRSGPDADGSPTRSWVVEVIGEADRVFYRAPVALP